jgi:hypothetical protein
MRIFLSILTVSVVFISCSVSAAESKVESSQNAKSAGGAKKPTAMDLINEEERWTFRPAIGRPDVFIDLEVLLTAQLRAKTKEATIKRIPVGGRGSEQPQGANDVEQLIAWGRTEEARIRQLVAARKYEEAMKASDNSLKPLEPFLSRPEIASVIVSIRTYRAQAEEAKIRDDAQAAFEALKISVLGVLWSQDGQRMTIINGENRALSVNDRVKDCVVINIDQDRVDFRFVFGRRRFEFPVYVDQSRSTP